MVEFERIRMTSNAFERIRTYSCHVQPNRIRMTSNAFERIRTYSCHVQPNPTPNFHHEGRLIPKSNPYFGEIYYMLLAMHLTHSTEQLLLVTEHVVALFEEWEENGLPLLTPQYGACRLRRALDLGREHSQSPES